jgi:hypothetical protein
MAVALWHEVANGAHSAVKAGLQLQNELSQSLLHPFSSQHTHTHTHMYVNAHTHTHTREYTHTHTHTKMHTHSLTGTQSYQHASLSLSLSLPLLCYDGWGKQSAESDREGGEGGDLCE